MTVDFKNRILLAQYKMSPVDLSSISDRQSPNHKLHKMSNPVQDVAQRQSFIHRQYIIPILLSTLHGYYNFVRLDDWLDGIIGLLKETLTIIVVSQFCFNHFYASCDHKRSIAERNVHRAMHSANVIGILYRTLGLIWGCYLLTTYTNDVPDNETAFTLMNNRLYFAGLMTMAFIIRLCFLKPGISELNYAKCILRYPWRFIRPSSSNKTSEGITNKH